MRFKILGIILLLQSEHVFSQLDSTAKEKTSSDTLQINSNVFLSNISDDSDNSEKFQQDHSGLLQASKDVVLQFSAGQWGASRYKLRGYSSSQQQVSVNDACINDPFLGMTSGYAANAIGMINRFSEIRFGISKDEYYFSGVGGYINTDLRASSFRKGIRAFYGLSNQNFQNKTGIVCNGGPDKRGWSLTAAALGEQGDKLSIPGTYVQSVFFLTSISKVISAAGSFHFTAFLSSDERGLTGTSVKEAYTLSGSYNYNSRWGLQQGKVRNANVQKNLNPGFILNHSQSVSKKLRLNTAAFYNFQRNKVSGINFSDASNPRPDYYAYLPSFYYLKGDTLTGDIISSNWSNIETRQINWDRLIGANQNNFYSGTTNNPAPNTSESLSRYIVENRVAQLQAAGINFTGHVRLAKSDFILGLRANIANRRNYKEVADLLGGSFWMDIDPFATGLGPDESIKQNNIDQPNRKVRTDDRFGYDYVLKTKSAELWVQYEYLAKRLELNGSVDLKFCSVQRNGFFANGKFPNDSRGSSEVVRFLTPGCKVGVTHKISGKHFVQLNGLLLNKAPEASSVFLSPDIRNAILENITTEKIQAIDASYILRKSSLKIRVTGFYTSVKDQIWTRSFWNESYNAFVNLVMKNVNTHSSGLEFGLEKTVRRQHVLEGALCAGNYVYSSRPTLSAWQDNNGATLYQNRTVYLKNYRVGNTPQVVAGLGYRYNGRSNWFVALYVNYFTSLFSEINPERRTAEATEKYRAEDLTIISQIISQEQLPNYYLANYNCGKSWRLKKRKQLQLGLRLNNLLNAQSSLISSTEQLRWESTNTDLFPNKYSYAKKRSFLIHLSLIL